MIAALTCGGAVTTRPRTPTGRAAPELRSTRSAAPGLRVELAADMQGSPLFRARIHAKNCEQIVQALADGEPSIRVWGMDCRKAISSSIPAQWAMMRNAIYLQDA